MTTIIRKALSRQVHSPIFASYQLHSHSRNFVSDHPRPGSSLSDPVVEVFAGPSKRRNGSFRQYATEQPRGSQTSQTTSNVETYSDPACLQPYYAKHPPIRDLPRPKKVWPYLLVGAVVGVAGWVAFLTYITNQEMISSSVVRQIMRCVKDDPELREILGEAIRSQPEWWLNGDPRINGRISTLQGNIDVSWRIRGTKGSGTLYFTSIRKEKGQPFTILRFKVICDDGTTVLIDAQPV